MTVARPRRPERPPETHDFRRPSKLGRDVLRVLELGHETFTRRLTSSWGSMLRATLQMELVSSDQSTFDEHVRAMPNPHVVLIVAAPPLPGAILVDVDVPLATRMAERLMGAAPSRDFDAPRRPSDVESELIRYLAAHVTTAIDEALAPLVDVTPELETIEYNPQLLQVASPSDMTLALSYRTTVSGGVEASGLVTVSYPTETLSALLESMQTSRRDDGRRGAADAARSAVESSLSQTRVQLAVRLNDTDIPAGQLAGLQVGDVLRLDHRVDEPARGVAGSVDVLSGHIGRRGSRRAIQVSGWNATAPPATPDTPADPSAASDIPRSDHE